MEKRQFFCVVALFFFQVSYIASVSAADELIFSTAPTQPPEQTIAMYQPIVDHLSRATGKIIVLKPARNFVEYTHGIRQGKYDIVFDGPHFVGWRMKKHGHRLLAKLPGKITFVVVARNDAFVKKYQDLAGQKVCAFESPNLLSLGFLDLYPSPASQPILVKVNTFKGSLDCVRNGDGVAAVMRDKFWEKRTAEQKRGLRLIYTTSRPYPHRAFSVSQRVDAETRKAMIKALIGVSGVPSSSAVLQKFRSKQFTFASEREYKGLGALLQPVWGYRD